ncbi:uncharacterized protein [Lolium perenne]|uniref:uncharacterized protein isoform X1 n=1 Tax=Lolium perenne TaxID=4522 RepID=UPI0021F5FF45|nr:uncharacterized protein LOC127342167 isoform X1 [Lolium perenne]
MKASARPSVVCGGTYVLNKPDGQFRSPSFFLDALFHDVEGRMHLVYIPGSVDPGSGELIWATFEVWFSYIGPERYFCASGQLMLRLFESQAWCACTAIIKAGISEWGFQHDSLLHLAPQTTFIQLWNPEQGAVPLQVTLQVCSV